MYENSGIRRYQEANVGSMGREKMIVLLYETMVRNMKTAKQALADGDQLTMFKNVNQAQQITTELRTALDHEVGGEIAHNLDSLYGFIFQENLSVMVDKNPVHLDNCIDVLRPLLEAWRQIPPGTAEKAIREKVTQSSENEQEVGLIPAGQKRPGLSGTEPVQDQPEELDTPRPPGNPGTSDQKSNGMVSISV